MAVLAAHTQKAVLEAAALEIRLELLLHVLRQRPPSGFARRNELGIVPLDELVQQGRLGTVAGIPRRSMNGWARGRARSLAMASEGVRFYARYKSVMRRWPSARDEGPEFTMPTHD